MIPPPGPASTRPPESSPPPGATTIPTAFEPPVAAELPQRIRDLVLTSLDDDKAEDTVVIDLHGKTSLADYMVVTTGRSARQVGAMADHLLRKLTDLGLGKLTAEGMPQNDWVLIDAGDVIVHLFRPEVRSFYGLEKMWGLEPPPAPAAFGGPDLSGDPSETDDDEDESVFAFTGGDGADDSGEDLDGDEIVDGPVPDKGS